MKSTRSRVLIGIGIAAVLVLLGISIRYFRGEQALKRYERKLLAQGEKLKVSDWIPAPVPEERNRTRIFRHAIMALPNAAMNFLGTNGPHGMKMCAPGKAIVAWAQPDVREDGTNSWEEELAIYETERPALAELETIGEHPSFDFGLDYNQGATLLLPQLSQMKSATMQLCYAAIFDLHQGDIESAVRRVHTALSLADGMKAEPIIISQLVGIAMVHLTFTSTWEIIQHPHATEEALADLQSHWSAQEFIRPAENALGMERAAAKKTAEEMHNSSDEFRRMTTAFGVAGVSTSSNWYEKALKLTVAKSRETVWRLALSYPDQLRAMKGEQAIIESVRMLKAGESFADVLRAQKSRLESVGIVRTNQDETAGSSNLFDTELANIFSDGVRPMERYILRILKTEVAARLTITAIAIKRFQLANGSLPQTLDSLVPKYLPSVPKDPVDNKPLRYRVGENEKYTLYSIGEDGVDDGGDPLSKANQKSLSWQFGRDLVWPQAASDAEVKSFRQKQFELKYGK